MKTTLFCCRWNRIRPHPPAEQSKTSSFHAERTKTKRKERKTPKLGVFADGQGIGEGASSNDCKEMWFSLLILYSLPFNPIYAGTVSCAAWLLCWCLSQVGACWYEPRPGPPPTGTFLATTAGKGRFVLILIILASTAGVT
jgi:hypothetical protein